MIHWVRRLPVITLCLTFPLGVVQAEEPRTPKAGVVRIVAEVGGARKMGTGFIVRLNPEAAYVVTASHVVEGDKNPEVEFFTKRNIRVSATVVGLEGGDPRGLALLVVQGPEELPDGLSALPLASSVPPGEGEGIVLIGFPRGAGPWSVIPGNIVAMQGRDIVFSAAIDERISGGPMLKDREVVGLVTGFAQPYGRAIPAPSVRLFLEGWGIRGEAQTMGDFKEKVQETEVEPRTFPQETKLRPDRSRPELKSDARRVLGDGTILIPETGLVWMVIPERLTWDEARQKPHDVKRQSKWKGFDWHIPSPKEVKPLLSMVEEKRNGPLSDLEGTFWVDDEEYRIVNREAGTTVLFRKYVDLDEGKFYENNEEFVPGAHKVLLVRPINR